VRILATYNIKGGVGKTAAAVNLGYLGARDGYRVLIWDLDPQGAATFLLRVRPRVKGGGRALINGRLAMADAVKGTDFAGLDLLPADFTYRNLDLMLDRAKRPGRRLAALLEPLAADYDLVILDCPPGISLLSESVLRAADTLLVPLIPTTLSVRTLDQVTEFTAGLRRHRPRLLAFCSMVDRRKRLHAEVAVELLERRPEIAATAAIPALSVIEQMAPRRAPVPQFAPHSRAAQSYEALWAEIVRRCGLPPVAARATAPY
jgi:chromosome partitioning protein